MTSYFPNILPSAKESRIIWEISLTWFDEYAFVYLVVVFGFVDTNFRHLNWRKSCTTMLNIPNLTSSRAERKFIELRFGGGATEMFYLYSEMGIRMEMNHSWICNACFDILKILSENCYTHFNLSQTILLPFYICFTIVFLFFVVNYMLRSW